MSSTINRLIDNIEKIIIGKRSVIEHLLVAVLSDGHVLIEDVPGVGKTQLVATLARSVNGKFNRVQFTPDVMPSDIMGFSMFNPGTRQFEYREGAAMCNFLLADEINRTSPKTQSSLLEIMEEFQVTVDGKTYKLPNPFMVLATQNPIESFGTYPLPEAQMDRFFLKLTIGYPNRSEEKLIIDRFGSENPLNRLEHVTTTQELIELKERVKEVRVEDCLKEYIINIVDMTRKDNNVVLGCSPRGSLNLYKASKAWAFIKGRDYVLPDDIQKMAVPVLSHRIIINQGAKMKNIKASDIISDIIQKTEVPFV
ncbi:AAA family ATPase [Acetivibrio mesophilus]|uniref:MoxR family ATPase n=1 Tax=Acetivibrio mesophilus TaxID=2487273 RepID=A0A4Q0I6E3_9FIRM|nr:MoxR family ATPase [Acetivibrio mesophilus]ODM25034.1 magnesium chelatase [Clostridium sp. Bc-iso-3]RXE59966.1 MoxR family ATPase [Acetivibrio mesophilus]HHV29447.1 MoxR family ATPase [Clostridium sp.]